MNETDFIKEINNQFLNYALENSQHSELWLSLTYDLVWKGFSIGGKIETDIFKQMASGEPIEARLPYSEPFILNGSAALIFNCNDLPKDVEHTNAFFRRFLIIGFVKITSQFTLLIMNFTKRDLKIQLNYLNGAKKIYS